VSERQWQGAPAAVLASRIFASPGRHDEGSGEKCVRRKRKTRQPKLPGSVHADP
jgi:hypothetical protein